MGFQCDWYIEHSTLDWMLLGMLRKEAGHYALAMVSYHGELGFEPLPASPAQIS